MTEPGGPIVVLGSLNMDLIGSTAHFPAPGETVLGGRFTTAPGGKGANQAVAAARAGGKVVMIGAVGADAFGAQLREHLDRSGVDTAHLRTRPGPSGVALITVTAAGENSIVVLPGANAELELTETDLAVIRSAALLVVQLEIPLATVVAAAATARAAGVPLLLNPSPVQALSPELLHATTLVVGNEGEAQSLGHALNGVEHLVVTKGSAGASYRGSAGATEVAGFKVAAIDTTGAGDAFTGALAVAWARGEQPTDAVRWACAAGALATTVRGAGSADADAIDQLARPG